MDLTNLVRYLKHLSGAEDSASIRINSDGEVYLTVAIQPSKKLALESLEQRVKSFLENPDASETD